MIKRDERVSKRKIINIETDGGIIVETDLRGRRPIPGRWETETTEKSNQEGRRKLDREFYNPRTTTDRGIPKMRKDSILETSREVKNWMPELAPWANGRFRRGTPSPNRSIFDG